MTGYKTKSPPMTDAEIRERYLDGDSINSIATSARWRNGLTKNQVRTIIFGKAAS